MGGVRWTESLAGPISFDQVDFNQAIMEGRRDGSTARLTLTLQVDDVAYAAAHTRKAVDVVAGRFDCPDLGGRLDVLDGTAVLFEQASELMDHVHLRMRYRCNLSDPNGRRLHLDGFKLLENDPGFDSWGDVTTLFTRIYRGSEPFPDSGSERARRKWAQDRGMAAPAPLGGTPGDPGDRGDPGEPEQVATAVLRITPAGFLVELASFRGTATSPKARARDVLRFGASFLGAQWHAYAGAPVVDGRPSFPRDRPRLPSAPDPQADWHTVPGRDTPGRDGRLALVRQVIDVPVEKLPFPINLHHLAQPDGADARAGERGVVLLVHGAGVRAEMFYGQPRHKTIVDALLEKHYDVWALNWRGSIDLPNVSYTLDDVARFDHPAAVEAVLERTKARELKALVHCQGSVSFMMAAVAGLLPRRGGARVGPCAVTNVVSSAISLFFEMTPAARRKQELVLPLVRRLGVGADPQWGIRRIDPTGAGLALLSKLTERPCGNLPCQIGNYIWGAGWDTLLCHDNIDDEVHKWTARELGYTPFSLTSQVAEATRNGHVMPADPSDPTAPATYVDAAPDVGGTRFLLVGCERDTMFLSSGQQRTNLYLQDNHVDSDYFGLPGYGHMDAYWGPNAAADVFPAMLAGLDWAGSPAPPPSQTTRPAPKWQHPAHEVGRRRLRRRWIAIEPPLTPPPIDRSLSRTPAEGRRPAPEEV